MHSTSGRVNREDREEVLVHIGLKQLWAVMRGENRVRQCIPHACCSTYKRISIFYSTSEGRLKGELMCIRCVTGVARELLKGWNAVSYFIRASVVKISIK